MPPLPYGRPASASSCETHVTSSPGEANPAGRPSGGPIAPIECLNRSASDSATGVTVSSWCETRRMRSTANVGKSPSLEDSP